LKFMQKGSIKSKKSEKCKSVELRPGADINIRRRNLEALHRGGKNQSNAERLTDISRKNQRDKRYPTQDKKKKETKNALCNMQTRSGYTGGERHLEERKS